jgi:Restriction endonuclease
MTEKLWENYEDVARHLLDQLGDHLGLHLETVEGKQKLVGKSGAKWEIDGKGVRADDGAVIVIECKRYPDDRVDQETIGGLAWRIHEELGASAGIVVTPLGLQSGAELVAKRADIQVVELNADATPTEYVMRLLDKICLGVNLKVTATLSATAIVTKAADVQADPHEGKQ